MADDVSVNVVGFDELVRGSRDLAGRISVKANSSLEGVARYRAGMVKAAVPRVTGRLAGSVDTTPVRDQYDVSIGSEAVLYAGWIEFGGTRGRPYMPQGRYLYPIATADEGQVKATMEKTTATVVRSMTLPKPPTTL